MRRREFITLLGGATASWPLAARGQQPEPMRRIGVLMQIAEGDAESKIQVAEFLRELRELGWVVGHNVKLDTRWAGGDSDRIRKYAAELCRMAVFGTLNPLTPARLQA